MNLRQELPKELKDFGMLMDLASIRHGYNEVFSDWIDYMIACFRFDGDAELGQILASKYESEYPVFDKMFRTYLDCYNAQVYSYNGWYDGLGIIYETIASRWKASNLGQFFTPPGIVDLMVMINISGEERGKTINDPTCGSGRMLIASHAKFPGNFQYGQDLDPICAKMSAINMMLHGCVGEVACMNTLTMEWYFGYYINPYLSRFKMPQIVKVRVYEDSIFYTGGSIFEIGKKDFGKEDEQVLNIIKPAKNVQLSLF
jgi:type I restriction enzyme M protein